MHQAENHPTMSDSFPSFIKKVQDHYLGFADIHAVTSDTLSLWEPRSVFAKFQENALNGSTEWHVPGSKHNILSTHYGYLWIMFIHSSIPKFHGNPYNFGYIKSLWKWIEDSHPHGSHMPSSAVSERVAELLTVDAQAHELLLGRLLEPEASSARSKNGQT